MTLSRFSSFETGTLGSLTAVGSATPAQATTALNVCFQVTVENIVTNVVIRLEGSLDNVAFFNLDGKEEDTILTEDGTYGYALNGCPVKFVRVKLVDFTGGSPNVSVKFGSA